MKLAVRRVTPGSGLALDRDDGALAALTDGLMLVELGESAALSVPPRFAGLWCPRVGRVHASSVDGELALTGDTVFASDSERALEIACAAGARCVGVLATQRTWARLSSVATGAIAPAPTVFPALHEAPAGFGAALTQLAAAAAQASVLPTARIAWLAHALHDMQAPYADLIARCRGRSLAHRKQTFLRLQRVRHRIATCTDGELDVAQLARMASYSNWHLIRSFSAVFGETPYAHFMAHRIARARGLIEKSTLGIGDIAMATGFDSQSSLTRAIKRHLGVSSSELRRRPDAAAQTVVRGEYDAAEPSPR